MKQHRKSGKPEERKTWAQVYGWRAVRMFRAGKSVPDIAEHFGDRTKQNRVRGALFAAGVYEFKSKKAVRK